MRKLALDIGSKSCGFALSDPLDITAQGMENFIFPAYDWSHLITRIKKYLEDYEIDTIVIGYPLLPSGAKSQTTFMIEEVESLIKSSFNVPIVRIDESYTSKRAHEIMKSANLSTKKRKKHKDMIAAQMILQDFLERI